MCNGQIIDGCGYPRTDDDYVCEGVESTRRIIARLQTRALVHSGDARKLFTHPGQVQSRTRTMANLIGF